MAKNENNEKTTTENELTENTMTDNEWIALEVKIWISTQIGDYRNKFRTHIDSINYRTLDELKQETENYIKNNPLTFTVAREQNKIYEDEIEEWKDIFEDRIAIHGENISSILEEDLPTELLEDMSSEELDDLIAYNIEFLNTYPIDTIDLTETT